MKEKDTFDMYTVTRFKNWYVFSPWRQNNNDCREKSFDSFSSFTSIYCTLIYSLPPLRKKVQISCDFDLVPYRLHRLLLISFSIILYKYKTIKPPLIYTLRVIGFFIFIYLYLRSSGYYIKWTVYNKICYI